MCIYLITITEIFKRENMMKSHFGQGGILYNFAIMRYSIGYM